MGSTIASTLNAAQAPALGAVADPTAAVAQGTSLFNAAYAKAGGDLPGTMAEVSGLIQDLPAGQLKTALNAAENLVSGAISGAAFGAALGPYGAIIGAAVGLIEGIVSDIISGDGPPPAEGEFRSQAEQYCFPAIDPTDPLNTQPGVLPASWANVRQSLTSYLTPGGTATSTKAPLTFTFETAWVKAPSSTASSQEAALALAQAWIGQNAVTKAMLSSGAFGGNAAAAQNEIAGNTTHATTVVSLGSTSTFTKALALVTRWYGSKFQTGFSDVTSQNGGSTDVNGKFSISTNITDDAYATAFRHCAKQANVQSFQDGIYYRGENLALFNGISNNPVSVNPAYDLRSSHADVISYDGNTPVALVALPDTALVGLCEVAYLCVTGQLAAAADPPVVGAVSQSEADFAAFHYMMGLTWLWQRGQEEDYANKNVYSGYGLFLPEPHPNFVRVLGIIAGLIAPAKPAAAAIAHTSTNPTLVAGQGAPAVGVAATGYTFVNGKLVKLVTSTAAQYVNGKLVVAGADKTGYAVVNGKLVSVSGAPSSSTSKGDVYAALAAAAALAGLVWYVHER